jgi:hypothetical protein
LYSSLFVESLKLLPVDASLSMIILVHETEDSSNAGLLESLDIQLTRRMSSDADSGITDLGEEELSQEVRVCFLNVTVDYPDFVPVLPLARFLKPKLTRVGLWALYLHDSAWFSLVNELLGLITLAVAVDDVTLLLQFINFELQQALPGAHLLTILVVEPSKLPPASLHLEWA